MPKLIILKITSKLAKRILKDKLGPAMGFQQQCYLHNIFNCVAQKMSVLHRPINE